MKCVVAILVVFVGVALVQNATEGIELYSAGTSVQASIVVFISSVAVSLLI